MKFAPSTVHYVVELPLANELGVLTTQVSPIDTVTTTLEYAIPPGVIPDAADIATPFTSRAAKEPAMRASQDTASPPAGPDSTARENDIAGSTVGPWSLCVAVPLPAVELCASVMR